MSKWTSPTKIRKKRLRDCKRKIAYPTDTLARNAMREVESEGKLFSVDTEVYRCTVCGQYHWGRPLSLAAQKYWKNN